MRSKKRKGFDAGYDCAGIDISPTMIEHCRNLVPGVGQLSTLDGNGKSEIPSKSADFVFSYAVLQHISRLSLVDVAISEMCRIVKRGGFIKFQYLSQEKGFRQVVPKQEVPRKTWNFEDWSLQLHYQRLPIRGSRFLPRVPMLKIVRHNNWVGVPLAHRKMEAILNRNGITVTGIEEDPGHKRMFFKNKLWRFAFKMIESNAGELAQSGKVDIKLGFTYPQST
jgi:SAM-dependent methyltransferase